MTYIVTPWQPEWISPPVAKRMERLRLTSLSTPPGTAAIFTPRANPERLHWNWTELTGWYCPWTPDEEGRHGEARSG